MKNNKSIIDTYETVYLVDIVIANKYTTLEQLKELYTYEDGSELDGDIMIGICSVSTVRRKYDNKDCILIRYNRDNDIKYINKKHDFINTIVHESLHVCIFIYSHMNQPISIEDKNEPLCYLAGWIGECMYKTLTKK